MPDLTTSAKKYRGLRLALGLIIALGAIAALWFYDQERAGQSARYQYGSQHNAITIFVDFDDTRSALLGRRGPRQIVLIAVEKPPSGFPQIPLDRNQGQLSFAGQDLPNSEGIILISALDPKALVIQHCRPPLFEKLWSIWSLDAYQEAIQDKVTEEREKIRGGESGQPFLRYLLNHQANALDDTLLAFIHQHNR